MKKVFLLFMFLVLAGCSHIGQVNVYEVNDASEVIDGTRITFTDRGIVDDFVKALHKMNRISGIADVSSPDFLIELSGKSYYLWISEHGGSIMDPEDSHTLYNLEETSAKEIYELFKTEIEPHENLKSEDVLISLKKQGLELVRADHDADKVFGMELNGERPESYELDGQSVYLYNFYSQIERQKGMEDWHARPPMDNLELYQVFGVQNILIFHVYEKEIDADIHAKFLAGLKFIESKVE